MPKRRFYIDAEQKQRIQVSWEGNWKGFTVFLNNEKLGNAPKIATKKESTKFILADGNQVSFRVNDEGELESRLNGYLIPNSGKGIEEEVLSVFNDILIVGLISIGIGTLLHSDSLLSIETLTPIFLGGAYVAIAYWFKKRPNYMPILIALLLLIAGPVLLFFVHAQLGLYAHIYYAYRLVPTFKIIRRLRESQMNDKIDQLIDDIGQ